MNTIIENDTEGVLRQWRTSILNGFFTIAAGISLPALAAIVVNAFSKPETWSIAVAFSIVEVILVGLALFRGIPVGVRVGGLWLIGYAACILNLMNTGLSGAGPLYLLGIPILILILAGKRPGLLTGIFSGFLAAGFAVLTARGLLTPTWISRTPWMTFTTILMFLTVVMALLILFYRFQERLIGEERHVQSELRKAHALLEEQNTTLEQKVLERTSELQDTNRSLERRAQELATVNAVGVALAGELDLTTLIELVGEQVRSVFKADIVFLALLDRENGVINFPYQYGEQSEPIRFGKGITSKIIQSGQPVLINQDMDRLREEMGVTLVGTRARSFVGVPIFVSGEPIGVVSVQNTKQEGMFTEDDQRLLGTIAANVGIALHNARLFNESQRLFQAERQAHEQAETLRAVAQALNHSLSLKEVFDLVLTEIQKVIPYDSAGIYQVQENRRSMVAGRGFANLEDLVGVSFEFTPQDDEIGYMISRSLQPLILSNASEQYPQYFNTGAHATAQIRGYMAVPIALNQKLIGMITLDKNEPDFYRDQHASLAMAFAAQAATAINNARLFDETQRLLKETEQRNAELALLIGVGELMVKTLDVNMLTRLVGDKLRQIFDADSVLIMLLDRKTNLIHVPFEFDRNEGGYIDFVEPFPLGTGLSSKVIMSGEPLMVGTLEEEVANGAYFPPEIIEKGSGSFSQSWLGVPIMAKDQVLGLVALSDDRPHAFNRNHLTLLRTLSSNVGVAIENARLFQEERQRSAELATINSVQVGLASKLDMDAIYELIGEKVREVFNVQVMDIVDYDPVSNLISMPYSYEKGDRSVFSPREPYGFREQVIRSRAPLLINQNFVELAGKFNNPLLTGEWPKSALFVPLLVNGEVKSIISIQDLDRENAYSDSDVQLLQTLSIAMSVALENARLWEREKVYRKALERELEIGREIQAGFLPDELPLVKGWEIAASLVSAREVAGDFYDVFELPDGNIGLVIADVCDKGVGAALFMTLFRSLVRATSNQEYFEHAGGFRVESTITERLSHAMTLTNNYIAETHEKSGMFATIFFGILDPRTGRLTYINGGHEPPLIIQAGTIRETLRKTGPAVGAITNCSFAILETQLQEGDLFFAFTDGVPDSKNPQGEFFGRERLFDILHYASGSAHALVDILKSELNDYVNSAARFDDITLMAVRRAQVSDQKA